MRQTSSMFARCLLALGVLLALVAMPITANAVTLQEEIDLGKKVDAEVMKQYLLSGDDQAQKEINEYGQHLVKGVRRPEIKYHFKVLKDNELNAFSIPGGWVYFSEHLWNVLNKDERIGVLAHEITHVDRRHAIDAMLKQQRRQIWLSVLLAAANAGQAWGDVASLAESLYTMKYSRGDEQQADENAVDLCQKANYNPAGILLAIRKIQRFEDERGGAPPKILSDHPLTKDRVVYLEQLLRNKGIPVPPVNVKTLANPNKVGEVTAVDAIGVTFTSSKPLKAGDVVWLMGLGWDYHYENHTEVPIARAVVTSTGGGYAASVWPMPTAKKDEIAKGIGVFAIPMPDSPPDGIGRMNSPSHQAGVAARLQTSQRLKPMERLLAVQVVWNKDNTKLIYDNVGYVIVTDPLSATGYLAVTRPQYSYAPVEADSILTKLTDQHQTRWVSPVVSIGRNGQTIEVRPGSSIDPNKLYDVAYPAWNSNDFYAKRIVGKAKLSSASGKIVLKMTTFNDAWTMNDIQNGFDVYEQQEPGSKDSNTDVPARE